MTTDQAFELVGKRDNDELKAIIKALESLGGFFNDDEDNQRLEAAKIVLKSRNLKKYE